MNFEYTAIPVYVAFWSERSVTLFERGAFSLLHTAECVTKRDGEDG